MLYYSDYANKVCSKNLSNRIYDVGKQTPSSIYIEMRNWCKNSHASRFGVELPPFYFIFSTMNFKDGNFIFLKVVKQQKVVLLSSFLCRSEWVQ